MNIHVWFIQVPVQILWLNLMTDSLPALALANEALEPDAMLKPPRPRSVGIIDPLMTTSIAVHTVVLTASVLGTYIWGLSHFTGAWNGVVDTSTQAEEDALGLQTRQAQTMVIYSITFAELLRGFTSRSLTQSVFAQGLFTNRWMLISVTSSIAMCFIVGNIPGVMQVIRIIFNSPTCNSSSGIEASCYMLG